MSLKSAPFLSCCASSPKVDAAYDISVEVERLDGPAYGARTTFMTSDLQFLNQPVIVMLPACTR
jgi:hypothetical protein